AAPGVYVLTGIQFAGEPLGVVFAFANAALFTLYIVLGHRISRRSVMGGIDGLAGAMLIALVVATPIGCWAAAPAMADPIAVAAGVGVGVSSSVIPYVCDQLAMRRMSRSTYALLVALLPATATVIGLVVLAQVPSFAELLGVGLVILGVAVHRDAEACRHKSAANAATTCNGGLASSRSGPQPRMSAAVAGRLGRRSKA